MVAVSEYSWEEIAAPGFGDPARQAFRAAVAQVAAAAGAKLPECNGRVESAVKLVLASDVTLGPVGTATVGSASAGQKAYEVRPGHCDCQDFDKAPHGLCKHRLAAAIVRRAQALLSGEATVELEAPAQDLETKPTPATLLPESLLPYVTHIKGRPFIQYAGLLWLAHQRGLVRLEARLVSVSPELALAEATATFSDGRTFTEAADASPANTGATVRLHYPRIALTRCKARALRDALCITVTALEELGGDD